MSRTCNFLASAGLLRLRVEGDMRAWIFALALTVVPGVTACSIDVRERGDREPASSRFARLSPQTALDMVIYPRAHRIATVQTDPAHVSFTGSFADTRVVAETFESADAPGQVLRFYRSAMRAHRDVIECRGEIGIRRTGRTEQPVCIDRPSSQVVQLATGARTHYRLVAVKPRGTAATEFTLVSVDVR